MHLLVPCGFPPVALAAVLCLARLRVYQDQRARRGPGGLSNIMGRVLKVFFNDSGPSFSQGVVIVHRGASFVIQGLFAGFLADLEGHRDITRWKGSGGKKCCLNCDNVLGQKVPAVDDYHVGLSESDPTKFVRRTTSDIEFVIEQLAAAHGTLSESAFRKVGTKLGVQPLATR